MTIGEIKRSLRTKTIRFEIALTMNRPHTELQELYKDIKSLQGLLASAENFQKLASGLPKAL